MNWSPRARFVEDILGVPESQFRQIETLAREAWLPPRTLCNLKTGRRWCAGTLETPSVEALRRRRVTLSGSRPGTLSVLVGRCHPELVDVGYLQAAPENNGAVFQVASNFNGLELRHKEDWRALLEVSNYTDDYTQGPFASISAAPGLLMRHYYPFFAPTESPVQWRQHFDGPQIELLSEWPVKVRNGYLELTRASLQEELREELVQVALHREVEVAFGQVRGSEHHRLDYEQRVSQVFTAAADLASTNRLLWNEDSQAVERVACALLRAAYEGSLRSALAIGACKVYLTLIGGGVFANPSWWIVASLEKQIDLIVESGLEVIVNTYLGMPDTACFERLVKVAGKTGGRLLQV